MSYPCRTVEDFAAEVRRVISEEEEAHPEDDGAEFFFRGEECNFATSDDSDLNCCFDSSIDRDEKLYRNERDIYQEALRLNVASFIDDNTMTDRITRMQHYSLPTRFADLSSNSLQSLVFAAGGLDPEHNKYDNRDGFVRVIKVAKHKMKSFTSDIIVAISHLPLVDCKNINPGVKNGLDTLRYEITKERPTFGLENDMPIEAERLHREIQQVWAFKPLMANRRLQAQDGLFLAYGCKAGKEPLHPDFSTENYEDKNAPSYGIKQIAAIRIAASAKSEILKELRWFGMPEEKAYPDLSNVCELIKLRFKGVK